MSLVPRRLLAVAVTAVLALSTTRAVAFQPDVQEESDPLDIRPSWKQYAWDIEPSQNPAARELSRRMTERLGAEWRVGIWNPLSGTARRAYGTGIDVAPGGISSAAQAEDVARDFIGRNPDLFGGATPANLATFRVTNALGKWAVVFQQTVRGIPVNEAMVHLVFTESGRLYAFGSDYFDGIAVPALPAIARESAVQIARNAVPYDALSEVKPLVEDQTMILPIYDESNGEGRMVFRLTHMTEVPTDEPYGLYRTWVDAATGEIVRRENQVTELYSGQVQGDVEIPTYCAGNTPNTPLAHMNVNITGVGTAETAADGSFSIAGTGGSRSFTAQFDGPIVNVNCSGCAGGDAILSGTIDEDVPEAVYFPSGTYRADERDCFYFINKTRDYVNSIDPAWTYPKVTANVNINATCNANWAGTVLNFFRTGGGCHNTGEIGDVMAHEYGHGIQYSLLGGQGPNGMGEGNADIAGTFIIDGSVIGIGFTEGDCVNGLSCPGSSCRDCENTLRYPGNVIGQPIHSAGRVICGFNWDTRQGLEAKYGPALGKETCAELWHFTRKLFGNTGYDQPDQAWDYFVLNDDDGDLGNGTPDYAEICTGAMNHGFPCPTITVGVFISHTPLGNTSDFTNPYPVVATITSTAGTLDSDSLLVYYRVDGGAYTSLLLTPTANPNEYSASLPAQNCGSSIDYYLFAKDLAGNQKFAPANAPASVYSFAVAEILFSQNFESASDWTQDPTHTATTGAFVRIDPNATGYQPGDDATPAPGVYGWITAQNSAGADGTDDVDNGIAATRSPIFDLSGYEEIRLSLSYFHGQRDQGDDPAGDFFRISVSNDGGATYPVNLVSIGDVTTQATWTPLVVLLDPLIAITDQMRIRVQASDAAAPDGDIVEGGIDDFVITGCEVFTGPDTLPPTVNVSSPNGGEVIVLGDIVNVTWSASDNVGVSGVEILMSQNGGLSYPTTIATGEANDGTYSWNTANLPPTNQARLLIRATDTSLNVGVDASNASFTLGPPPSERPEMTLLTPNGGELVDAQASYEVTWNAFDDVAVTGVDLFLSTDGGLTYPITIATNLPNTGSYVWSVEDLPTTQARLRAVAKDGNFQQKGDVSDADFTITLAVTGIPGDVSIPQQVFIGESLPEPFSDRTRVRFGLPKAGPVEIAIYSVEGRMVRRLASGPMPAGRFEATWDGRDDSGHHVTSGPYFLRLTAEGTNLTKRITFVR